MMIKTENPKVTRYSLKFTIQDNPEIHSRCMWADIYLDHERYTLMAHTDCGNYIYGWPVTTAETFLELMCRITSSYLLGKISKEKVFDLKDSKDSMIELLNEWITEAENEEAAEKLRCQIVEVEAIDDCGEEGYVNNMDKIFPDLIPYEQIVVVKDYPVWAKTFCEVFINYLQPILKEELVSNPNRQYDNSELMGVCKEPKCYRPNDNPYPLCKGAYTENMQKKYQCIECCIYEDYPESQGY